MPKAMQGSCLSFARCVHTGLQLTVFSSPTRIQVGIRVFSRFSIRKPTFFNIFHDFHGFCHRRARAPIFHGCTRRFQSLCSCKMILVVNTQLPSSPPWTIQPAYPPSLSLDRVLGASSAMSSFPRDLRKRTVIERDAKMSSKEEMDMLL